MELLPASAEQAATFIWIVSLVLGLVVSLVVTILLWLIHREATAINACVSRIWEVGQRVANNTVHIPALYKTNEVTSRILTTALEINEGAAAIEAHAVSCQGCPQCLQHPNP